MHMTALFDVVLVLCCVLGALGFLVWQVGWKGSSPSCHPTRAGPTPHRDDVSLGDSLARGLTKAEARRGQK